MKIETALSEIRQSLATVSALHAAGNLNRADLIAAINLVESCCDDIAAATAPSHGFSTLPILKLADVVARAQAAEPGRREAEKRLRQHLMLVPTGGDAA